MLVDVLVASTARSANLKELEDEAHGVSTETRSGHPTWYAHHPRQEGSFTFRYSDEQGRTAPFMNCRSTLSNVQRSLELADSYAPCGQYASPS